MTPSRGWEAALRRCSIYLVWALAGLLLLFGVYARFQLSLNGDPVGITGDLYVLSKVWTDLTGLPGGPDVSLRINQFGLAAILGVLVELTGYGWAHSADLLALCCSILLVPAAALFVFAMGGNRFDQLAAASIVATSPVIITQTLRAESESPFVLCCAIGVAAIVLFWRTGRASWGSIGILALALSMAIRGPGVFHALFLAAALTWAHRGQRHGQRPPLKRLVWTWTAVLAAVVLYVLANVAFSRATERSIESKLGVDPVRPSYTAYILYDGILLGPFPDQQDWTRRFELTQRPDSPVRTGKPPLQLIRENFGQYVRNYFEGVYLVSRRFLEDRGFNVLGFWPLVLGIALLARRRDRIAAAVVISWIAVYVLVLPALSVQERQVWPAALALAVPGAYILGYLIRALVSLRSQRSPWAYWTTFALVLLLIAAAANEVNQRRKQYYKDFRAEMAELIFRNSSEAPVVYAAAPDVLLYGMSGEFVQIQSPFREPDHIRTIAQANPDFIVFDRTFTQILADSYQALRKVMNDPLATRDQWELIWSEGGSELWAATRRPDQPDE